MELVENAVPQHFLADIVEGAVNNLDLKKFHLYNGSPCFLNYTFFLKEKEFFSKIAANAMQKEFPGCKEEDFKYVYDAILDVKQDLLEWDRDEADSYVSPCVNLWIPISDTPGEKFASIFEKNMETHHSNHLCGDEFCDRNNILRPALALMGVDVRSENLLFWDTKSYRWNCVRKDLVEEAEKSVLMPRAGDVYVSKGNIYHKFEAIQKGITVCLKLIYTPAMEIKRFPWFDCNPSDSPTFLFLACKNSLKEGETFEELIPYMFGKSMDDYSKLPKLLGACQAWLNKR
jgi:hypothetical protein